MSMGTIRNVLLAAGAIVVLSGCSLSSAGGPHCLGNASNHDTAEPQLAERWDGSIQQWGTMREVLKEGHTQPRIRLREAAEPSGAVGVGALEGLQGEVTIVDGQVWLAKNAIVATGELPTGVEASATLLTVAYVPEWLRIPIGEEVLQHNLDRVLRDAAQKAGINVRRPFPFILEGRMSVQAHVIRGKCPHGTNDAAEPIMPYRFSRNDAQTTLVAFYAEGAEGILTHHGSATHMHVVIHDDPPLSGHVDSVSVAAGAVLRLPAGVDGTRTGHRCDLGVSTRQSLLHEN